MAVTTGLIKELRERTGAGMLDCKKALEENAGDIEKSIDWLREKGIAKAAKKSGRVAAEGLVFGAVTSDRKKGAILEFNSETDFVAKNEEFKSLGEKLGELSLKHDVTSEDELKAFEIEGKKVEDVLTELIAKIGENMNIRRLTYVETTGFVETYIHLGGKVGVLLDVQGEATPENIERARGVSMHIAAMDPKYLNPEEVTTDDLDREREISRKQLEEEGKPANIIEKILEGENWRNKARSPLTEVGVDVNVGDYIIAINGTDVAKTDDLYELLVNTAGTQVELTVNGTPSKSGSRKVIIVPISDEAELYYYNWVQKNIKKVSDATNGQVGYIHIPDMSVVGLNEFAKYFYPQKNKKAFIIDDRGNGGGNVSPMILDRLMRDVAIMGMSRNTAAEKSPESAINGPIVCLIDNYSASDGDLFPYKFKKLGLGKLIGKRSWGGVIGIRGTLPLMDGGYLMRPEFGHYSSDGEGWIIEGYGVDPDIEIDNDPAKEYIGEDEQLNAAIKHIQEELKNYKELPGIPEFPDRHPGCLQIIDGRYRAHQSGQQ